MKDPYSIIVRPHITEKSVALSYGDERSADLRLRNEAKAAEKAKPTGKPVVAPKHTEGDLVRKYTFIVNRDANKIEIKQALEAIYKAAGTPITVDSVRTVKVLGKKRRRGQSTGYEPNRKKAIVTLAKGQMLEDYGV